MTTENSAVAISATPKKVSRKPAGSGKKKTAKKSAKKSAKKGVKKSVKRESNGISGKAKSLLTTLLAAGATSAKSAMDKQKALKKADVTTSTVITLKQLKLIERVDLEDGNRTYFLSAAGKAAAVAASKEE